MLKKVWPMAENRQCPFHGPRPPTDRLTIFLACASLIAQFAIDVLTERFEFEDEVIDVYRALPEAPFDRVGRYRRPVLEPA